MDTLMLPHVLGNVARYAFALLLLTARVILFGGTQNAVTNHLCQ